MATTDTGQPENTRKIAEDLKKLAGPPSAPKGGRQATVINNPNSSKNAREIAKPYEKNTDKTGKTIPSSSLLATMNESLYQGVPYNGPRTRGRTVSLPQTPDPEVILSRTASPNPEAIPVPMITPGPWDSTPVGDSGVHVRPDTPNSNGSGNSTPKQTEQPVEITKPVEFPSLNNTAAPIVASQVTYASENAPSTYELTATNITIL